MLSMGSVWKHAMSAIHSPLAAMVVGDKEEVRNGVAGFMV
jgi:hypothetical protein